MINSKIFLRRILAVNYLEYFLVSAISAVLVIRLFLKLTGYPQIGGETLHIAHMLWGGLLMLISIFLLFSFIGRTIENISAIIGSIGFGTFIDEIGKFITQNNDYFYQPAVALIYLIFILIFLVIQAVHHRSKYSSREYLVNALRESEDLVIDNLDMAAPKIKNQNLPNVRTVHFDFNLLHPGFYILQRTIRSTNRAYIKFNCPCRFTIHDPKRNQTEPNLI